jgi:hypothetical protein
MKIKLALIILCLFFSIGLIAQSKSNMIVPGKGVGKLKLGISKKRALNIVGVPTIREGYDEAVKNIFEIKSNPYNWVPFQTGFDSLFTYSVGSESFPVHSLYLKNDTLIAFSLSAFSYKKWWIEKFSVNEKVYFNNDISTVNDSLPFFYATLDYSQGRMKFFTQAYYFEGVSILIDDKKVKMIEIFRPVNIIKEFGEYSIVDD